MTEKETATLSFRGESYELGILKANVGPDVIDIRTLYRDADVFTYDPGFTATASTKSAITYIDGDKGILLYRGYPIDQLAEQGRLYGDLLLAALWRASNPSTAQGFR